MRAENNRAPIMVLGLYHPYVECENNSQLLQLIQAWNDEIREVIRDYGQVTFVPTLDLFQNKPKHIYFSDSIHPSPAGYELIANRLIEVLESRK